MKPIYNPEFDLYEKDFHALCDSLQVAESFEKEHKEILKTLEGETRDGKHVNGLIDDLRESGVNTPDYFIKTTYKDSRNRTQPKYLMTRDGFVLLAMGFTGRRALRFKLAYINRFNRMEAYIIQQITSTKEIHPSLMDAIRDAHEPPRPYHYSNEQNMIYKIVLGCDAKEFRRSHGLAEKTSIKPYLTAEQIKWVNVLQQVDIGLHEAGLDYAQRKEKLTSKYQRRRLKIPA